MGQELHQEDITFSNQSLDIISHTLTFQIVKSQGVHL